MIGNKELDSSLHLVDKNQSFWDLATIQLTGLTSLPLLATSVLIIKTNTILSSILTLILSNLILWLFRYIIILMSHKNRKNTIEIIQDYLGDIGKYVSSVVVLAATLAWFCGQTTIGINAIISLFQLENKLTTNLFIQGSIIMGIISTFFCTGGIIWLKRLSLICFPIMVVALFIVFFLVPHDMKTGTATGISIPGLMLSLGSSLGVTVDLPTFFRHSRSKKESLKALGIIQIFSLILSIIALYLGSIILPWEGLNEISFLTDGNHFLSISLFLLIFLSVICANVSNVYAGSVGWEVWAPKSLVGKQEYLLIGLGLTAIFIFFANMIPLSLLLEKTDSALVNICIVLIIGYLICLFTRTKPNLLDKYIYFLAWLVSVTYNLITHDESALLELSIIIIIIAAGRFMRILNKFFRKN